MWCCSCKDAFGNTSCVAMSLNGASCGPMHGTHTLPGVHIIQIGEHVLLAKKPSINSTYAKHTGSDAGMGPYHPKHMMLHLHNGWDSTSKLHADCFGLLHSTHVLSSGDRCAPILINIVATPNTTQ